MVESTSDGIVEEYVRIIDGSTGDHKEVRYSCRIKAHFRVAMDLEYFPFDGDILRMEV